MATKLMTCPDTGHRDDIHFIAHPPGMLIRSCTRPHPRARIGCPRTAAPRLDQRMRLETIPPRPLDETEPGS